jgi:hypothetical protein
VLADISPALEVILSERLGASVRAGPLEAFAANGRDSGVPPARAGAWTATYVVELHA